MLNGDVKLAAILARCTSRNAREIDETINKLAALQRACVRQLERAVSEPNYSAEAHARLNARVEEVAAWLFVGVDPKTWAVVWNDNGVSPAFYLKLPTGDTNAFDGAGWIVGECP